MDKVDKLTGSTKSTKLTGSMDQRKQCRQFGRIYKVRVRVRVRLGLGLGLGVGIWWFVFTSLRSSFREFRTEVPNGSKRFKSE